MNSGKDFMRIISLVSAIALLAGLSFEVLSGHHSDFSQWYLWLQFAVCIIFMSDFLFSLYYYKRRATLSEARRHRAWLDVLFLLISLPYLNVLDWLHLTPGREITMLVATLPIIRSYIVMGMVVQWMLDGAVAKIFGAYVLTIVGVTYLAALMFYDYEIDVNDELRNFGNALWWSAMNATTVGSSIIPVTIAGKFLSVLLPVIGMMFFPIFTIYVTDIYNSKSRPKHNQ